MTFPPNILFEYCWL